MAEPEASASSPVDAIVHYVDQNLEKDASEALDLLGRIGQLTGLERHILCERLGCDLEQHATGAPPKTKRALTHSREYLGWIYGLATIVERPTEEFCRQVVAEAFELYEASGSGKAEERLVRCREAFASEEGPSLTPRAYLRLGEVATAFEVAALNLSGTPAEERQRRLAELLEPLDGISPHIHPERLAHLDDPDGGIGRLGVGVRREIQAHLLARCQACCAARDATSGRDARLHAVA